MNYRNNLHEIKIPPTPWKLKQSVFYLQQTEYFQTPRSFNYEFHVPNLQLRHTDLCQYSLTNFSSECVYFCLIETYLQLRLKEQSSFS